MVDQDVQVLDKRGATREWEPVAHVVVPRAGTAGPARVTQARVQGTPVTALCGWTFVPSRDPRGLVDCVRCEELLLATDGLRPSDLVDS